MALLTHIYRILHPKTSEENIPYYWKYSVWTVFCKPIRKFFSAVVIPTCPFNGLRIIMYRICGYKIGKNTFIGMRCYLDDMCFDKIEIGNNVIISYGVYFACHGRNQGHNKITICDGAYIGMKSTIIARTDIKIGGDSIIGACTLINKDIPPKATAVGIPCRII